MYPQNKKAVNIQTPLHIKLDLKDILVLLLSVITISMVNKTETKIIKIIQLKYSSFNLTPYYGSNTPTAITVVQIPFLAPSAD